MNKRQVAFALPGFLVLLPFIAAILVTLRFSFSADSQQITGYSFDHYLALLDPYFSATLARTLILAVLSTLICLFFAIPLALLLASVRSPWWRRIVTCLILLPMILNLLIQSYGWMIVLGFTGIVNSILQGLSLTSYPIQLMFNDASVLIGLVETALPLAVFPILSAMRAVDGDILEASANLGAKPWHTFSRITLPLLEPGIISAAAIVFAFNAGAFAVPLLLGGGRVRMMGTSIRDMVNTLYDWGGAAAAGMVLIIITFAVLIIAGVGVRWLKRRRAL